VKRTKLIIPVLSLLIFISAFTFYTFTSYPDIAAYRDTGELVTVSNILGVAHPTGYPLYTILGNIFQKLIPFGTPAYRQNIMSGFFSALTLALLFLIIIKICCEHTTLTVAIIPALVATITLALAPIFWRLSVLSESYTLDTFFILLLILLTLQKPTRRTILIWALIAGLSLTNRMTLILLFPAFLYLFWKRGWFTGFLHSWRPALILFMAGLSLYLYLPIRSLANPLIDWANPETIPNLWRVLTRSAYGHGLDTISKQFTLTQVYGPQMLEYFRALFRELNPVGIALSIIGVIWLFRKRREVAWFTIISFIITAPLFIAISKMPPNPHALAIMEAHYIIPNLFVIIWCGCGIAFFLPSVIARPRRGGFTRQAPKQSRAAAGHNTPSYAILITVLALWLAATTITFPDHFNRGSGHNRWFGPDFGHNLLVSLPQNSIVILRKDVQLFNVWYNTIALHKRPDIIPVAQGLYLSKWYRDQLKARWPFLKLPPVQPGVTTPDYLIDFAFANTGMRPVLITSDVERNEKLRANFHLEKRGLATRLLPISSPPARESQHQTLQQSLSENLLKDHYWYRGEYDTTKWKDFYPKEILLLYSIAWNNVFLDYWNRDNNEQARRAIQEAISLDPEFALGHSNLGILYLNARRYEDAIRELRKALKCYEPDLKIPGVKESIAREVASTCSNLGVAYERAGDIHSAEQSYLKAIQYDPTFDQSHYNLGVIYWQQGRWRDVVQQFQRALELNPENKSARKYLQQAKYRLSQQ